MTWFWSMELGGWFMCIWSVDHSRVCTALGDWGTSSQDILDWFWEAYVRTKC